MLCYFTITRTMSVVGIIKRWTFLLSPLQELPQVDFTSWNSYADPTFRFYDQSFLDKCRARDKVCVACVHTSYPFPPSHLLLPFPPPLLSNVMSSSSCSVSVTLCCLPWRQVTLLLQPSITRSLSSAHSLLLGLLLDSPPPSLIPRFLCHPRMIAWE